MPASQILLKSSNATNFIQIYRSREMNEPRIEFIVTTLCNICDLQSTKQQAYCKIKELLCERISDCGTPACTSASFGTNICIKAAREGHCWKQM